MSVSPSDWRNRNSSRLRNDPVGLFGFTRTMARVRPVTAAASAWSSIDQAIGNHAQRFHGREKLEQWIRRPRHQDFVARIGQQLKKVRIRFAGAGGEQNAVRRDRVT